MTGQFTIIQNKALDDERLTFIDKLILLSLQSMMGKNGYCWPSYEHLASKAKCSRISAIRSMKRLVYYNYVIKETGTVGDTNEQSSNRYYINNNPTAGEVSKRYEETESGVSGEILRKDKSGVSERYPDVVSERYPEKDKFFEKNARACACAREASDDTTSEVETESGLLPVAKPDEIKLSVPCKKSSDEDIRLCKQVSAEWKRAFNKSLWIFGEIVKRKQHNDFYFRVIPHHKSDFDFDFLKGLFANVGENVALIEQDTHFADEERVDYYDA